MRRVGREPQRRNTERWHAELHQRWPYGLGAALIGVLLPVVAGAPDVHLQVGELRGEFTLVIVAVMIAAGAVLALAALVDRSPRSLWFGIAVVALVIAHPMLETAVEHRGANLIRMVLAASVIVVRAGRQRSEVFARDLVGGVGAFLAILGVGLAGAATTGPAGAVDNLALISLALAAVLVGGIDFVLGQRETDGAAISLSMALLSFSFSALLRLASGGLELTAGVAIFATVAGICAFAGAVLAVVEALARREIRLEALELSLALADARLQANSTRMATTVHDQRGALLAIEAAAQRLEDRPDRSLAAAVAAEAARLQRTLASDSGSAGPFSVVEAIDPMLECIRALGVEISLVTVGQPVAWGVADEVVEVVRNLVDNSRTHGVGPIRVEVVRVDAEVVMTVSDAGPGVSPSLSEAVFERGVTTDPSRHRGLGLSSGREIAERHGGSLRVSPTRASAFELRLPVQAPPPRSIPESEPGAAVLPFRRVENG